mmetsp:Transcript_38898/g.71853  ORF Transcript_38898/g.71853 Transcript_38898/m.71853 type:complete len:217 (-) Transcript_38898:117-767(-)
MQQRSQPVTVREGERFYNSTVLHPSHKRSGVWSLAVELRAPKIEPGVFFLESLQHQILLNLLPRERIDRPRSIPSLQRPLPRLASVRLRQNDVQNSPVVEVPRRLGGHHPPERLFVDEVPIRSPESDPEPIVSDVAKYIRRADSRRGFDVNVDLLEGLLPLVDLAAVHLEDVPTLFVLARHTDFGRHRRLRSRSRRWIRPLLFLLLLLLLPGIVCS